MKIKEITLNDNIQHQDLVGELKGKFKVTNISIAVEIDNTESAEEAYTFARVKLNDLKDIARKDIVAIYNIPKAAEPTADTPTATIKLPKKNPFRPNA